MKFYDGIIITIFILLVVISLQESILEELGHSLGNHMIIEHMLFFAIGALSVVIAEIFLREIVVRNRRHNTKVKSKEMKAGSVTAIVRLAPTEIIRNWEQFLRKIFRLNKYPWIWITIALLLMAVWHIPYVFDYAFTNSMAHVLQHISFVAVGAAIFVTIRILGESFNLFLLLSLVGMMGFGGLIFVILDNQVYQAYSIKSHYDAGVYMIISSILLLLVVTPIYLIRRTIFHLKAKG
jgi:hypothetical protein